MKKHLFPVAALGLLLSSAAGPIGCGDDGSSSTNAGGAGGSDPTGTGGNGGTGQTSTSTGMGGNGSGGGGGAGTGGGGGGSALDTCLDIAMGDPCGVCACNNCLTELEACQADEGCVAIRECAQQAMCTGLDCLGPCGDTIDMYGGLGGPSAGLALDLSGCVENSCAMECGG